MNWLWLGLGWIGAILVILWFFQYSHDDDDDDTMKPNNKTEINALALPADWQERATASLHEMVISGYKEFSWQVAYKAGWNECATRARAIMAAGEEGITEGMKEIVAIKDMTIAELERENKALEKQIDELEAVLPAPMIDGDSRHP